MILTVIAFKNTELDCSTNPQYVDVTGEVAATQLSRSLKVCKEEEAVKYAGLVMYQIAKYDDEKMTLYDCEPVELLDCRPILANRGLIVKKAVRKGEDGTK